MKQYITAAKLKKIDHHTHPFFMFIDYFSSFSVLTPRSTMSMPFPYKALLDTMGIFPPGINFPCFSNWSSKITSIALEIFVKLIKQKVLALAP